jgi:hypothetical protein
MDTLKKVASKAASAIQPSTTTTDASSPVAKPTGISLPSPSLPSAPRSDQKTPRTPKTPANEAIEFFSAEKKGEGDPIEVQVWELALEDDGGPSWERRVSILYAVDNRCGSDRFHLLKRRSALLCSRSSSI